MEKRLAGYTLIRETGRGEMSIVYQALDVRLGRMVALKVLMAPAALSPDQQNARIARLQREARAIGRLSHPNIVAIYDVGEQDGQHFLVEEYLEGITLRERMDRGPLPAAEASLILDQLADALDAAHARGIVHRDIKPSNVMLLPDGRVKLLDFGVARDSDDAILTQTGGMVGSPAYMSPEQVRGEMGTPASDLWALGVLLYEMLAGYPPFAGANILSVLYQVNHQDPAPLPRLSAPFQKVVGRALEKDPAGRYRSARELADALRAALATVAAPRRRRGKWVALPIAFLIGAFFLQRWFLPVKEAMQGLFTGRESASRPATTARIAPPPLVVPAARARPRLPLVVRPPRQVAPPEKPPDRAQPEGRRTADAKRMHGGTAPVRSTAPSAAALKTAPPKPPALKPLVPKHGDQVAVTPAPSTRPLITPSPEKPRAIPSIAPPVKPAQPAAAPEIPGPRDRGSASDAPQRPAAKADLLGAWQGNIWKNPATLVITHQEGDSLRGTVTAKTDQGTARLLVTGEVSPDTGRITLWATGTLPNSERRDWDMGRETGHILTARLMGGLGRDLHNRIYTWSFSR